jgi:hypothetical protein
MSTRPDTEAPFFYRILVGLGRPLGLRWVGDNEVAVVYHLERYHSIQGPGFFWINPLTQTMRARIRVAPDFVPVPAADIHTRDALQLGLTVVLAYRLDPALLPDRKEAGAAPTPDEKQKAALYLSWSRETHRAIVIDNTQRALQAVVPAYYAEEICRGEVFEPMERQLLKILAERLRPLALSPLFCMTLRVEVPVKLQDRFEAVVQRRVNIDDIGRYLPYELNQALRTEALEALRDMSGGRQYINLPDFTSVVTPSQDASQAARRQIVRPDAGPRVETAPEEPPTKRPKSRL